MSHALNAKADDRGFEPSDVWNDAASSESTQWLLP